MRLPAAAAAAFRRIADGSHPPIIGMSGHRDLPPDDSAALRDGLHALLGDLRGRFPDSPLWIATGLAEGADRLVAQIALEQGINHLAVLPRPAHAYLRDFASQPSRDEFEDLLNRSAERVIAQPDPDARGYTQQAMEIVRRSDVLLALWDGIDDTSGTAEVVRLARSGLPGKAALAVWWIPVRRGSAADPVAPTLRVLLPQE